LIWLAKYSAIYKARYVMLIAAIGKIGPTKAQTSAALKKM